MSDIISNIVFIDNQGYNEIIAMHSNVSLTGKSSLLHFFHGFTYIHSRSQCQNPYWNRLTYCPVVVLDKLACTKIYQNIENNTVPKLFPTISHLSCTDLAL